MDERRDNWLRRSFFVPVYSSLPALHWQAIPANLDGSIGREMDREVIDLSQPLYLGIVQPWDCDVMGHFTVRRYAAAFDDASYQLLYRLSGSSPVTGKERRGWADVRQVYEYRAEMLPGTMFSIVGAPVRLGTKSLDVTYRMIRSEDGSEVASMSSTLVRLDLASRQSVEIELTTRALVQDLLTSSTPTG